MENNRKITPLILCGGMGKRLEPLSTPEYPKPFLKLFGNKSLLQLTAERFAGSLFLAPAVACHRQHMTLVYEQLQEVGVVPSTIIVEPTSRNTAPAIVTATQILAQKVSGSLLVTPADHWIPDASELLGGIANAANEVAKGRIVMFGIKPTGPELRFGYMKLKGNSLGQCHVVERFIEKPENPVAERMIQESSVFWNSGIFLYDISKALVLMQSAARLLTEEIDGLLKGVNGTDDVVLLPESYQELPSIAFDYAVIERTKKISAIPLGMEWSDVGDWPTLSQVFSKCSSYLEAGEIHEDTLTLKTLLQQKNLKVA